MVNQIESFGVNRPLVSPDLFTRQSSWSEWIDVFEAAALVNGWDDNKKRLWLLVRLTGKVQTVWKRLSTKTRESYAAAKKVLQKWFEPESKRKLYFIEFQAMRHK